MLGPRSNGPLAYEETMKDQFKNDVEFKGGHYQVKLPWIPSYDTLPDNYQLCRQRLGPLVGKRTLLQNMKSNKRSARKGESLQK